MHELAQDLRQSVRTLLKQRGFAAVVVATLAVGIGGNAAIFSFVNGVLLRPLPYPEPDRIVRLHESHLGHYSGISSLTYLDWKTQNEVFDFVAAHANNPATLTGQGEPVQLRTNQVTAEFFNVFGIRPALGRTFQPGGDEPGRPLVAVISDALWRSQFGADPGILGRTILLDDQPHTIVGVLPGGTAIDRSYHQLWRPLVFTPQNRSRSYHWLGAAARLKPGVTLAQARANMDTVAARIAESHPDSNKDWGAAVNLFQDGVVGAPLRHALTLLMVAIGAVLVIACVNVASLFLTRGLGRGPEIAIRLSLGATRGRLVRQFATEGFLLCGTGALLGFGLSHLILIGLLRVLPERVIPAEANVVIDLPVLGFAAGLTIITTLICAVFPAIQVTRPRLAQALQLRTARATGSSTQTRWTGVFVVLQVSLAFVLFAAAGLLVRSFEKLQSVDPGVDTANLFTARLPIAANHFPTATAFTEYLRQIKESVTARPGVIDASFTISRPLDLGGYGLGVQIAGAPASDPANRPFTFFKPVSASYFRTTGIHVVRGRALSDRDTSAAPRAAVINDAFAQKYFPDRIPLGERVILREVLFGKLGHGADVAWEVVGVVSDERVSGLENDTAEPIVYVTDEQSPQMISQVLVVRTAVSPRSLEKEIRAAIHRVNPDQVVTEVRTMDEFKSGLLGPRRFQSGLIAAFAALALVLAGLGIYGVLAYSVHQRTRELGIRSALGATARQIATHVLARGMTLVGTGLALGLAVAFGTAQLMSRFLYGITERDPVSLAAGGLVLAATGGLACFLPARRAAKIDPIICLRSE